MKQPLVLIALIFCMLQSLAQPAFKGKITVTIEQKWNRQTGKKLRYDWVVKDAAGNVRTYDDYHIFESYNGDIFITGRGFPETKFPYRRAQSFGLINVATGQEIFPCKAQSIDKRSECLIQVVMDRKHYLFSATGEPLNSTPYDAADTAYASNQKTPFSVKSGSKYAYADTCGKLLTTFAYDEAWSVEDGVARVRIGDKWTWLDASTFKQVVPARFNYVGYFANGVAPYTTTATYDFMKGYQGGKVGILNKKGEILTEEIYEDVQWQNGKLAGKLNGQWLQLNPSAPANATTTALTPIVDREFHKQVQFGYYKYGYKLAGDWIVKPKYDIAYEFQGNFALVGREGKDKITTFGGNKAPATEYGLINIKGEEVNRQNTKRSGFMKKVYTVLLPEKANITNG